MHPCTGRTAHRGSRGIALPFHDHGTRRSEGSGSRPGRSLPPANTGYPLYRRLGRSQVRSRQVRKISPPPTPGIWSPDRPAHSQSLYRLSYRPTIPLDTLLIFRQSSLTPHVLLINFFTKWGSNPDKGKIYFFSPRRQDLPWSLASLPLNAYRDPFPAVKWLRREVKSLTT